MVGQLDLLHHDFGLSLLFLCDPFLFELLLLDVVEELLALLLTEFLLSNAFLFTLSDLVNDDSGTVKGGLLASNGSLFMELEIL